MSVFAYTIRTPRQLLEKAERELERLVASEEFDAEPHDQSDHGYNCAISLWHIVDWLTHSSEPEIVAYRKHHGFERLDDLHAHVRKESDALHICYQLATGAKHFQLSGTAARRAPTVADTAISATAEVQVPDLPPYVLKIVLADGTRVRAKDVFADAVQYWNKVFASTQREDANAS